jgi:hypothetical protein|tara:strand:- start:21 stop:182 length:162 start_codon:yes stop_codon:yes gene_type:complete
MVKSIDPTTIPNYESHLKKAQERDPEINIILDVTEIDTDWIKKRNRRKGRKKK